MMQTTISIDVMILLIIIILLDQELTAFVAEFCPGKREAFAAISSSQQTVIHHLETLSRDIEQSARSHASNLVFYSIALMRVSITLTQQVSYHDEWSR